MDVFISYRRSDANSKLAKSLAKALGDSGVSTWFDKQSLKTGEPWAEATRQAILDANNIVVMIDPEGQPTRSQESEWRAALEAVWTNPQKRLIPLLMGNAEIPGFVRNTVAPGREIQAIRVEDPRRDWKHVVSQLVTALKYHKNLGDVVEHVEHVDTTAKDRAQQQERIDYITRAAESFKPV